jgi:alanine racemase
VESKINFSDRPSKIIVNLQCLDHNLKAIRAHVGQSKIMAVVKANAYGHGLIECANRIENAVDYFGVAIVEEGEALRHSGIKKPIHVFGGILGEQISRFLKADLDLTASSVDKLQSIEQTAQQLNLQAKVHLKIDTGMGRIGVRPESAAALIEFLHNLKHVKVVGIFSHFACSDEADLSFSEKQLREFLEVVSLAKAKLGEDILAHISNSAAVLNLPQANLDMVRPGLIMYGVMPSSTCSNSLGLKAVLSVESRIVYFKVVKKGSSVSYGRSWTAETDTRVVTVPIGYADGYSRALTAKAKVLINSKLYPVVGKICMDQLMVNIGQDSAYNQDQVVLIGTQGQGTIRVEDLAEQLQTVPHEVLSNLNLRMQREFVD